MRKLRALAGICVYALAGPPVGGVVAWLMMGLPGGASPLPFVLGSWQEGWPLALGVGIVATAAAHRGHRAWWVPVGAALVVSAAFILLTTDPPMLPRVAGVLVPPAIVASLACWWLAQRLIGRWIR